MSIQQRYNNLPQEGKNLFIEMKKTNGSYRTNYQKLTDEQILQEVEKEMQRENNMQSQQMNQISSRPPVLAKWQEILKAPCGTEKIETEKILYGKQKNIDADGDGEITGEDFKHLRANKSEGAEETIVSTLEKEGGASGLEPLEEATNMSGEELEGLLNSMENVVQHKSGDYILLDGLPLPEEEEEGEEEEEEEEGEEI